MRSVQPRFQGQALEQNLSLVETLKQIASEKHATPAQLALAWLLAKEPWIVPIPGTRERVRPEENIGASTLKLTLTDLQAIDRALASHPIVGKRYGEHELSMVNL